MIGQILKELFTEKTRIILTILAVAWGTFSISLMLAVGQGLRVSFGSSLSSVGKNLLIVTPGTTSADYKGVADNTNINIYPTDYIAIEKSVDNVSKISQVYLPHYQLRRGDLRFESNIAAVSPDFANIHNIKIMAGGRFINPLDIKERRKVIVLGTSAWEKLFPYGHDPVGQTVKFSNIDMTVVGVMRNKPELVSSNAPDSSFAWVPESTYRLLADSHTVDNIAITYNNSNDLPIMKQEIRTIIALANGASPNDPDIVNFQDVSAQQRKTNNFLMALELFLGIVGALTLIVAGTGIANVMFASVKQNTRMIGLRMAIGARPYQILTHYVLESMIATAIGGVIGIVIIALLVWGVDSIPLHGRVFQVFGKPELLLSPSVILVVVVVLGIIGFAAGFFPARIAASIEPAEALRHD
jgi:putative ABC transport system permease protein